MRILQTFGNLLTFPRTLTDERQASVKLSVLQKHVRQLRRKGKKFEQTKTDTQASAAKSLDAYAKASCRRLCDKIYDKLPQEVRDMIYGYLHTRSEMHVRGEDGWSSYTNYFTSVSATDWLYSSASDPPEDIWWVVDFVGERIRREMSEHYYRSVLFLFDDEFNLLSKFRVADQWKLGFVPADLATNIGVHINCGAYDFDGLKSLPQSQPSNNTNAWNTGDGWNSPNPHKDRSVLLANLEQLFGFKKGTKISIKFSVNKAEKGGTTLDVQQWLCDTVLTFVRPSLERLTSTGCSVRIILGRRDGHGPYIKEYRDKDFVFKSKTFEQDTIQSSFELVSLRLIGFVSITYDKSSKQSR
jgi:hypothetical protein